MKFAQRLAIRYIRTKFKLLAAISKKKAAEQAFDLFCTPQRRNKKALPKIFGQAENLSFRLDGMLIKGWRWKAETQDLPASGKRAMIIHGFESSVINFDRYVKPLVKKGYEVLAFDAPAHGESSGKTVNAVEYGAMIREVISLYGPVDAFICHSFGGIAISLLLEQMHHDANTKLVLIAPATETVTAVDGAFRMLGIRSKRIRQKFDHIIYEKSGRETAWFSIRRAMQNIQASVLWIHDEDDDITPLEDALRVKADNHHNIRFIITKGLGHRKIYRSDEVVDTIVKFL